MTVSGTGVGSAEEIRSRVAIIVFNWNHAVDTLACLRSVQRVDCPDYKAVVVDIGSAAGGCLVGPREGNSRPRGLLSEFVGQ